jgi:hypothetical protein
MSAYRSPTALVGVAPARPPFHPDPARRWRTAMHEPLVNIEDFGWYWADLKQPTIAPVSQPVRVLHSVAYLVEQRDHNRPDFPDSPDSL